ncbi:MAG TPA: polyprenyl synthetase family protein [Thermoanaerobaculia bacterium]|jgi:geranylgeranyl diphosphate synthase type I|nr:polyprenyl synthetase family protein [Thermoanaerobaculia bacterium]
MKFEAMRERVRNLREISQWPQALELVDRTVHRESTSVWEYPIAACQAVGGREEDALPAAAATFCSMISIHLVDDILDSDPRGDYRRIGAGPAANLALAFQAAGHLLLEQAAVKAEVRAAVQGSFAALSLATCYGQGLDARELTSEEEYWSVVGSKTPPLFGEAFRMGALLGGATAEAAELLARVGQALGLFIQVNDDMADALATPACADWQRRHNNLPILYALTADHPERETFVHLSSRVDDPEALAAAQKILLRSGAISFCTFKLIGFSREIQDLLRLATLKDPAPVARIIEVHIEPLHQLLEKVGVEEPAALVAG